MKRTNQPLRSPPLPCLQQVVTGMLIALTAIPPSMLYGQPAAPPISRRRSTGAESSEPAARRNAEPAPRSVFTAERPTDRRPSEIPVTARWRVDSPAGHAIAKSGTPLAWKEKSLPRRAPFENQTAPEVAPSPPSGDPAGFVLLDGTVALLAAALPSMTVTQSFLLVIGQAVSDEVPETGAGRIESAGSEDDYLFTNSPGQTVFFDSSGRSGGAIYWQAFDAVGNEMFARDFNSGDPGQFTLPVAGTNRIRAYGINGATGTYGFEVWEVPSPQSFAIAIDQEVRDGIPEAGAGRIESPGARDVYAFTNSPGQRLYFDSFGRAGGAIYWQALDVAGNQLFARDFNSGDPGPFTLPVAGTNWISVYGVGDAAGTYGFAVREVPSPQSFAIAIDQEVRDGIPEAGAGRIESPGAVDVYAFTNSPGQRLYFDSFGRAGGAIYWQALDVAGNQLFARDFNSGDPGPFTLPVAGTNWIWVYGVGDAAGTYGFAVREVPSPQSFVIAIDQEVRDGVPEAGAGRIESPGAEDFYTFTNSAGQTVNFDSLGRTGGAIYWQAFDALGDQLFNRDLGAGDPGKFTLLNAGANQVRVYGPADGIGTYGFVLRNTNSVGSITNQPLPTDRFVIAIGDTVTNGIPAEGAGNIETPGARDIYSFQATSGALVYFEDLGAAQPLDWALRDEQDNLIFNDRLNGGDPGRYYLSRGGTYTITVRPAGSNPDWIGSYSFRLIPVPNDSHFTIAAGDTVTNGVPAEGAGNIEAPGARDIYSFQAASGSLVYFEDLGAAQPLDWILQDEQDNLIFNDRLNGGDPGRYYLSRGGSYTITVQPAGANTAWIGLYSFKLQTVPSDQTFSIAIGDTVANAVPAVGAGNILEPGERDHYIFQAERGTTVYFEDLGAAQPLDWAVYDDQSNLVFNDRLNGADPGRYQLSRGGTYTITVQPAGANVSWTGLYSFRLRPIAPDQRFEISIGETVAPDAPASGAGNLEGPGERDLYTFQATSGTLVYFEDLGATQPLDWAVYDETGSLLFNDRLNQANSRALTLSRGGDYQIVVQAAGADPTWVGPYSFRLWTALPQILDQPQNIRALTGSSQTFSVNARTPFGPLSYQWRLNGNEIEGATNSLLFLTDLTSDLAGTYDVVVQNTNGVVISQPATLTVDNGQFIVDAIAPDVPIHTNLTDVVVHFNQPVLPASLSADDITIQSPTGLLSSAGFTLGQVDSQTWRVAIPAQSLEGVYTIQVGPSITNNDGNPLTGDVLLPVYTTDFEEDIGPEWSRVDTLNSPVSSRFLGRFGNETVALGLNKLPPHSKLRLVWDLDVIDGWDGEGSPGPDYFGFTIGGHLQSSWEYTFRNAQGIASPQSYPGTPTVGISNFVGNASLPDSIYRSLQFDFAHTNDDLTLEFFGRNLEAIGNESWGLDNVRLLAASSSNGVYAARAVIDKTPPNVTAISLTGTSQSPVQSLDVVFSEPIQAGSISAEDFQLTGPLGTVTVTNLQRIDAVTYRASFPWQSVNGSYQLTVGPDVTDLAGNPMTAAFASSFAIETPLVTLAGPRFLGENVCTNGRWHGQWEAIPPVNTPGRYRYEWSFSDGGTAAGSSASHDYLQPGVYSLVLNVFDYGQLTTSLNQEVAVAAGLPPVAQITGTDFTVEGEQPILLNGLTSQDDERIWTYRWLLPTQRFPFNGRFLDANRWIGANTLQDDKLIVTGQNGWGTAWFNTVALRVLRGGSIEGRIDTSTEVSRALVGLRDPGTPSGTFASWIYGLFFQNGNVQVYEKNLNRGTVTNYTVGASYDFRIETKPGAGAIYFLRPAGSGLPFAKLFDSPNYTDAAFGIGATVYEGVFGFDDLVVEGAYVDGASVMTPVFDAGQVTLEVIDHALQTNTASAVVTSVTGAPPAAVINGPASGQTGVELLFDAYGSSDDHALASYTWEFDDGSPPAFSPSVPHRFDLPGVYAVTVTVADYANQTATATLLVTIAGGSLLRAVPWRIINGVELPHETVSGKVITLKAVAPQVPVPFDYVWDFGDGSMAVTNTATNAADAYGLEATHAYSADEDTPFWAEVRIVQTNGQALSDTYPLLVRSRTLDVEMNIAIDEGLWWLHKRQNRYDLQPEDLGGDWTATISGQGAHQVNVTASAVQAFAVNGHGLDDDVSRDPYVEPVRRGMNFLLNQLEPLTIGPQAYGNPDANANGIGLTVTGTTREAYELPTIMDALVAAASPETLASIGGPNVAGRTYRDLMQDMVDTLSWGQYDSADVGGGWRYAWNSAPDNSASQWPAIGLLAAERYWGIAAPDWVKERNVVWLNFSRGATGFGYTDPGNGFATTPSAMVQMAMDGLSTSSSLWQHGEDFLATNWVGLMASTNLYAYYATAKAMRTANPPVQKLAASGKDWFMDPQDGLARVTVDRQRPDGSWFGRAGVNGGFADDEALSTAWSLLILSSSLFQKGPVALVQARPTPAPVGYPIIFDGRGSYHQHPSFQVIEWRWDFDSADGVDFDHPDAIGSVVTNYFSRLGTHVVSLQVRDNNSPQLTDTDSIEVEIGSSPFRPVADAAGPYLAAVGEDLHLDGSGSFDIDAAQGDFIQAWDWEVDFASPLDFNDGVTGEQAVLAGGFDTPGQHPIGLRVTDSTATVFPESGLPDQTHADYTTAVVYQRVITNLTVRAKQTKCQLQWTKAGDYAVILRSRSGPNHGFEEIGRTDSAYATFLDTNVAYNIEYFYRLEAFVNGQTEPLGVSDAQRAVSRPIGPDNLPPYFVSTPIRTAPVDRLYEVTLEALDPENDPFVFNMLTNPPGMTLDRANGIARFTPTLAQVGSYPVTFEVTNAAGRDVLSYDLLVLPLTNTPPLAFANGPYDGTAGAPIQFYSRGSRDPDGDAIAYLWSFGDGSTSTDPNPTHVFNAPGSYTATVFVNDSRGGTASSGAQAIVARANRIPVANAGPNQVAYVSQSVRLDGSASYDLDGTPITFAWSFASRPADSAAALQNPTSSRPSFVADVPGTYVVRLIVSDGIADSAPDAAIVGTINSAPIANAGPDQRVALGGTAQLDGSGSLDLDRDPLTYRWTLLNRPQGSATLLVDSNSVSPTLPIDLDGGYEVQLIVNDGTVDSLPDTVLVTTRNFPPEFPPGFNPPTNAIPNVPWRYDVVATDPYDTNLTLTLFQAPTGMGLTPGPTNNAVLNWTPTTDQLGDQTVTVRVTDSEGSFVDQSFVISVGPDVEPPVLNISLVAGELGGGGQWAARLESTATFRVTATDNADGDLPPDGIGLQVGSDTIILDSAGQGSILASVAGFYDVVATATDAVGNVGTAKSTILFYDPDATNSIWVQILSPTNGATVTKMATFVATITNATDLTSYRVDYARAADIDLARLDIEGSQYTTLTNVVLPPGTRVLDNAALATFDATSLLNDDYVLRLMISDGRSTRYEGVAVAVSGELKFGELRLQFTDLSIPVAGIPITITRVYDSREAGRVGDFGHGWKLGVRDANIRKTLRNGTMFPGSRVYLNTPSGKRVGFTTSYQPSSVLFAWVGSVSFEPEPGVYEKLDIPDDTALYLGGVLQSGFSDPFSPSTFRLTLKDGTVYTYDEGEGLEEVVDLNTNRLSFTANGIFHSDGERVEFIRDSLGRITEILDPAGNSLRYTYDAAGDLRSFSDRMTNVTQYLYHTARAHYLTNIIDPLGRQALRMTYDANGRLATITDAAGNPIHQEFDLDSNTIHYTDANGNPQFSTYDESGNETAHAVVGIYTNRFEYDANNNLVLSINGRGFATNYTYDVQGNVTSYTDALSNRTSIGYNTLNKPVAVTNALGQRVQLGYDTAGRVTELTDSAGQRTMLTRDSRGLILKWTDPQGNTTSFNYENGCSCGQPGTIVNADGSTRLFTFNARGQKTSEQNEVGAQSLYEYDSGGHLITFRDPLLNVTRYDYEGANLISSVDALNRTNRYEYDDLNRTNKVIDAEGHEVEFRYDPNGNRTQVIDPLKNVTTFVYDAANRLIQRIDPLGHTNLYGYDAAGNRTEAIDRNGRRRTFAYDALNRMTNELWWEGTDVVRSIVYEFDALGLQTLAADPEARYESHYDSLRRLDRILAQFSGLPDLTLSYTYTALGKVQSVTDNGGVRVASTYDNRNRLSSRTWEGPGLDAARVDFSYDAAGNRLRTDRFADLAGGNRIGHTEIAYNLARLATNITHLDSAGAVLDRYDYLRDAAYQIIHRSINSESSAFSYDLTGQLTNAQNTTGPAESFGYDANGNRTGTQSGGSYVVGANNQILSDGVNHYTYDAEGNLTSRSNSVSGALTTYQCDYRNRLVSVSDADGGGVVTQTVAFAYDARNRRLSKSVNGQVQRFLYNQDDLWADGDSGGHITARYLYGEKIDECLARQSSSGGQAWYLVDNVGSIRALLSRQGMLLGPFQLGAFGNVENGQSNLAGRLHFTGREYDPETGLYYYRARYYSPALGRFLSQDPLGFESNDTNPYRYVLNSPLIATDPTGQLEAFEYILLVEAFGVICFIPTVCSIGLSVGDIFDQISAALAGAGNGTDLSSDLFNVASGSILPCGFGLNPSGKIPISYNYCNVVKFSY
jgi:RHS repeat-associated protein